MGEIAWEEKSVNGGEVLKAVKTFYKDSESHVRLGRDESELINVCGHEEISVMS